jgi:hypothetical protein
MTSFAVAASMVCTFALVCFVVGAAFSTCCLRVFAMNCEVTVSIAVITLPDLQLRCVHFRVVIFRVDEEPEFDASVGGFRIVCENNDGLMGGTVNSWFAAEWFDFRDVDTCGEVLSDQNGIFWKLQRKQLEAARRDELVIAQKESSRRSPGDKYIMARGGPEMDIHYPPIVIYHSW